MGDYKSAYNTWIQIVKSLKDEGYEVDAQDEKKHAQACLEKIKQ